MTHHFIHEIISK
jgi:hypothetical protein